MIGRIRVVVVVVASLTALASCTDGGPPLPPDDRGPNRPPAEGVLRIGYPEEPATLNPIRARSPASRDILRAVLPSFFLVTPSLKYEPYLLAGEPAVRVTNGRMEVRFRIRDDARWSDGTPMTVTDVEFTRRVMTDPSLPVAVRDGFEHLAAVEEESPKVGTLVLEPPYAAWRDLFSAGRFVLPAHRARVITDVKFWDRGPPVTAGPFSIDRWVRGLEVRLVRNARFFGPPPLLEVIEVTFVPDPTTAVQLLAAGRLDAVAPMLGVSWRRRLQQIDGVRVSSAYGPTLLHLAINTETISTAFARQRIVEAIDRTRFAQVVLQDDGRRADGILAPEQEGAVAAWAGYGRGDPQPVTSQEITLAFPTTELASFLARHVQDELERAGGDVELLGLDADVFQDRFLPARDYDMALWESRSGPLPWLDRWFLSAAGESPTGLTDPELDRLVSRMLQAPEPRGDLLRNVQERLAEFVPVLPIFQPRVTMAWRKGVEGLQANPTVDGPLWNTWNWSKAAEPEESEEAAAIIDPASEWRNMVDALG